MKSLGYILWVLAVGALILVTFQSALIWLAAPLLVLALLYSVIQLFLYRPPENHLGVVYRFGRFSQLVGPDEWTFILPGIHRINPPVSLNMRRLEATLTDLLTQDQFPVECGLLVFFRVDLRLTDPGFRVQALSFSVREWEALVRSVSQETAAELTGHLSLQQLLRPDGRNRLRQDLARLLSDRLRGLGLAVDRHTGVSVQMLKPEDTIWQAMNERLSSLSLGEAALARVYPVLEELSQRHPEVAWNALLLELAAAMNRDGTLPQLLVAPGGGSEQQSLTDALLAADAFSDPASKRRRERGGRSEAQKPSARPAA